MRSRAAIERWALAESRVTVWQLNAFECNRIFLTAQTDFFCLSHRRSMSIGVESSLVMERKFCACAQTARHAGLFMGVAFPTCPLRARVSILHARSTPHRPHPWQRKTFLCFISQGWLINLGPALPTFDCFPGRGVMALQSLASVLRLSLPV